MRNLIIIFFFIPVFIFGQNTPASNENILYTGRIDFSNAEEPNYSLNGVSIKIRFEGTAVSAWLSSSATSYMYIVIDGDDEPTNRKLISINGNTKQQVELVSFEQSGEHTVELIKLDESSDSKVTFYGFDIMGGSIMNKPERPPLQLEFIGDSNPAGWNAWNAYDNGRAEVSGAYHTYPGMVSRMLGAEYSLIGASGSGVTDRASWNCTRVWDRVHLTEAADNQNLWDFDDNYWGFSPEAVVVNLGANDFYANTPKTEIKKAWKEFITNQLRINYPSAHIVLANSYGWAVSEPADYVNEAIEELINEGESNVSYVLFPWLWGQQHAVVNEHAGFANILAAHLAKELNLDQPTPLDLSSFTASGTISNGSFERSTLAGMADGWRPQGSIELIEDSNDAVDGINYMRCRDGGLVSFATLPRIGSELLATGSIRAKDDLHTGFIKLLFKDQGQNTISSRQIQPDFTTEWTSFSISGTVPNSTWSIWLVLESEEGSIVDFDNISLSANDILSIEENVEEQVKVFPNPTYDILYIESKTPNTSLALYSIEGKKIMTIGNVNQIDLSFLQNGLYLVKDENSSYSKKILKK